MLYHSLGQLRVGGRRKGERGGEWEGLGGGGRRKRNCGKKLKIREGC